MNKWTWSALAGLLVVASGSYYLLSQRQEKSAASDTEGLDVEAFGDDAEGEDGGDNTYELLDDPAQTGSGSKASPPPVVDDGIKTIDDDDDMGETVKDPVVIDDDEEGSMEAAKPKK